MSPALLRRALIAGAAAAAMPARAAPSRHAVVVSATQTPISTLDLTNAVAGGHFAAAGLAVETATANTTAATLQQLVAGRCQFVRAQVVDVLRAAAGQATELLVIACLEQEASYVVLSAAGRPVDSAAALAGRRVGVLGSGTTTDIYLDLLLASVGIAGDGVTRFNTGAGLLAFAPLLQGRLDALVVSWETAQALAAAGEPVVTWPLGRYVRVPGRCYVTTRALAAADPGLARAFVQGIAGSVTEIIAGPAAPLVARAALRFELAALPEAAEAMIAANVANWLSAGRDRLLRNPPEGWRTARDRLQAALLPAPVDETPLYTNALIDQVLG